MAVPATAVFEIQSGSTAANVNGAGFDPGNANMATDLTTDTNTANTNSPVCSSASYNFVAGDVNAWLYVKSGTNWTAGWYKILSVASNKATLSAAVGAAIQMDAAKGYPTPRYLANTVAGCATVGTPTSGVWTIDYSQGTAAIATAADLVIDAVLNTKVTSATRTFGASDVGNCIHVTAGTSWTVGWYFIVSVAAGAATLDRSPGIVTLTGGTWYEGGAASLNSSTSNQTDNSLFGAVVAGNRVFMKGALSLAIAVSPSNASDTNRAIVEGYQTLRGDAPTGSNRPTVNAGAFVWTFARDWDLFNVSATGSASPSLQGPVFGRFVNVKVVNTSTTASRSAITVSSNSDVFNCEAVSYRGNGFNCTGASDTFISCYAHDSDVGFNLGSNNILVQTCIVESCVTAAISMTAYQNQVLSCTLYGAENKQGIGINLASGTRVAELYLNNIIYGFVTGISGVAANVNTQYGDFNDFFNNTTDVSNSPKGPNDQALDPAFVSVSQITGTAGKFRAGNDAIIDTSKNFTTLGVVAGRDCIYIKTGTGATAGIYGVSSIATTTNPNDTLLLDLAPGTNTTADKAYQLTVGHNFAIGTALKAKGFPGAFPASLTTGYSDIGAVQRSETGIPMRIMGVM